MEMLPRASNEAGTPMFLAPSNKPKQNDITKHGDQLMAQKTTIARFQEVYVSSQTHFKPI
eukprot:4908436-Amphidinium_carterae.1